MPKMFQGFKTAGRTPVAAQGLDGKRQRTLHLRLLVAKASTFKPLTGCNQRGVIVQMRGVMLACTRAAHVQLQAHQGIQHIQALQLFVASL